MARQSNPEKSSNKALFGIIIIVIGLIIFLSRLGMMPIFDLQDNWPLILIAIGIFLGVRNRFSTPAPFILLAIGIFNIIPAFTFMVGDREVASEELVAPLLLILGGLVIVLKAKKKSGIPMTNTDIVGNDTLVTDVVFGGRKEIVTAKDFRGGRVAATFGGAEVNLLQADTTAQTITIDVRATFAGCEIIVPSNWDIKNEVETILGSVDDKRTLRTPDPAEKRKTLVLRGSCFCSSVEIKSF